MAAHSELESHILEAALENVLWLVEHGGCTLEQACSRAGVTPGFVEKRLARARARETET